MDVLNRRIGGERNLGAKQMAWGTGTGRAKQQAARFCLPQANSSATVFAGLSMGTMRRVGSRNVKLIGAKPFTGSYGAGPMAGTEQNCEPTADSSVYPSGAAP